MNGRPRRCGAHAECVLVGPEPSGGNDNDAIVSGMKLWVLALDGVFDAGLALVLDTFDTANALASHEDDRVAIRTVGVRRRVRTHHGLAVPVEPWPRTRGRGASRPDVLVVPALGAKTPDALHRALGRPDVLEARARLAELSDDGAQVAAACTATFVLADAGLLAHKRATTTWWLAPFLRQRHADIDVDERSTLVDARGVVTAGAALAHVDLALWLVQRHRPALARLVAHHLLDDGRRSQGSHVLPDRLAHGDDVVEHFERFARAHLRDFAVADAARAVGASERTLERRVRAALGRSPVSFVQDLRVAHAVRRLSTSDDSVDEVASEVGYSDGVTLRALLKKKTGRGVRELRGSL